MNKDGEHLPPPPASNHMTLTQEKIRIIELYKSSDPQKVDEAKRAFAKFIGPSENVTSALNSLVKPFVLGSPDHPDILCYAGNEKQQSTILLFCGCC